MAVPFLGERLADFLVVLHSFPVDEGGEPARRRPEHRQPIARASPRARPRAVRHVPTDGSGPPRPRPALPCAPRPRALRGRAAPPPRRPHVLPRPRRRPHRERDHRLGRHGGRRPGRGSRRSLALGRLAALPRRPRAVSVRGRRSRRARSPHGDVPRLLRHLLRRRSEEARLRGDRGASARAHPPSLRFSAAGEVAQLRFRVMVTSWDLEPRRRQHAKRLRRTSWRLRVLAVQSPRGTPARLLHRRRARRVLGSRYSSDPSADSALVVRIVWVTISRACPDRLVIARPSASTKGRGSSAALWNEPRPPATCRSASRSGASTSTTAFSSAAASTPTGVPSITFSISIGMP